MKRKLVIIGAGPGGYVAAVRGIDVRADTVWFRSLGKAHVIGEIAGQARIIPERESGRVLGVHIVGPHASDLIAKGASPWPPGPPPPTLPKPSTPNPTLAEILMETAFKAVDRPLHGV